MTDNKYSKTRKAAADALIYWAKTGMRQFTMRDAVNEREFDIRKILLFIVSVILATV